MSFGNGWGSMADNEARKAQAIAQQQQQEAQRRAAEMQSYERSKEQFQQRTIAQEQNRRNQESQHSMAMQRRSADLDEWERKRPLRNWQASFEASKLQAHEREMQQLRNQPAMEAAKSIQGMMDVPSVQSSFYDRDGSQIGGGFVSSGQPTPVPGARKPFLRESLLRR